jgi:predicted ArsR family transcriptional regulator
MAGAMNGPALTRARRVSSALFGAKHRLPVAIEVGIAPERGIYAAQLAGKVKASETQVGTELKRLADVGLLELLASQPTSKRGQPPRAYQRRKSAYWDLARELGRERTARKA